MESANASHDRRMDDPNPDAVHDPLRAQSSEPEFLHRSSNVPVHRRGDRPLPSHAQIQPITPAILPSYRRLITLLLPIRYPDKFFKASVADTSCASLARVAIWDDKSIVGRVVGGIQCRLEDVPSPSPGERQLYIQTIAVLSPFRQLGLATHLLNSIISTIIEHHHGVSSIYAHVWEANTEALEWYERRGFAVEEGVVQDYYRRLKPAGAKVVRRRIGVEDHLAVSLRPAPEGAIPTN